jgi:acetolactate synthase-1/2/3 large subunit
MAEKKYSDLFMEWLHEAGYTHCFYVPGGNSMHLLESASSRFKCVPFLHEASACIATDYFNEISSKNSKAFLLVTAGPGLTNAMTGIVGAWVESRELLIIGGQAKSTDLSKGKSRQVGFQEIDGVALCKSVSKKSVRGDRQISKKELFDLVNLTKAPRKGPVFIEMCIDISFQNRDEIIDSSINFHPYNPRKSKLIKKSSREIVKLLQSSERPLFLLGGGVDRETNLDSLFNLELPIATTFNGSDRASNDYIYYCGRPNWYGSRWANLIIQQSDLIIALGTRLGINQTGYNVQEFAPKAKVIQIEIDKKEKKKKYPKIYKFYNQDCNHLLNQISLDLPPELIENFKNWKEFINKIKKDLINPETENRPSALDSSQFIFDLMNITDGNEIIVPCSSGIAAYESAMRVILNKDKQKMVTSHGLASMGYGVPGGIGAAIAYPNRKTIVFEGDGGFAQNMQELGTALTNKLNLKIFLFDNNGYHSIKLNQKSSFNGHYIGCDNETGIELPNWEKFCESFGIQYMQVNSSNVFGSEFNKLFNGTELAFFTVSVHPDQTYWPRIISRRVSDNEVVSDPLHKMYPPMSHQSESIYMKYLKK